MNNKSTKIAPGAEGENSKKNKINNEETMTDAQRSYLKELADEAGENMDENQSKDDADVQINALEHKADKS